jgi:hypothetical protein
VVVVVVVAVAVAAAFFREELIAQVQILSMPKLLGMNSNYYIVTVFVVVASAINNISYLICRNFYKKKS